MSTFKHLETGKRFLFAHIPRTGGRFVEENLKAQGWVWDDSDVVNRQYQYESVDGVEIAHFHREYYEKYLNVKDIPHVCIIRNPIDRFISASIYIKLVYGDDIQELMEDPMYFHSMLENYPCTESVNWYRSQLDFLSDKTHVWRFEDGLGENFSSWLSDIVGVDIKMDQSIKYSKQDYETNKLDKTPALLDNIRTLYRKEIGQLYPELATSQ
jgi:hypothetical protein